MLISKYIPAGADRDDALLWLPNGGGSFIVRSTWEAIRTHSPKVLWRKIVWHKSLLPWFSLMLWQVLKNRLPTGDRLARYGIASSDLCSVCHAHPEIVNHLFFECFYSQQVWNIVMEGITSAQPLPWSVLLVALLQSSLITSVHFAAFIQRLGALVYYIWRERNCRHFEGKSLSPSSLASIIASALLWLGSLYVTSK